MAKNLSTFAIAQMLHVDPGSVANWIDRGLLRAHRTPGGHRRVTAEDLIDFLRDHKMPIPAELSTVPKRVLVVDGRADAAKLIARAVRTAHPDCEVVEASDAFRAGAQVAALKPDVVLLDLEIPGMDPFEVCRWIKSERSTRHVEIIALSNRASAHDARRIRQCGARACLGKPPDKAELLREIQPLL